MTIDDAIEKYDTLEFENMTAAAEWYQKFLNFQDCECKTFGRKCEKEAGRYKQLADWLKELKELQEQKPCEDAVSRKWLLECVNEGWIKFDTEKDKNRFIHLIRDIAPKVSSS